MSRTTKRASIPVERTRRRLAWTLLAAALLLADAGSSLFAQRMMPFSMWKNPGGVHKDREFLAPVDSVAAATSDATGAKGAPLIIDIEALYPTPFGPASPSRSATATIVFRTLEDAAVSVRLYNVLGQPLTRLHEGYFPAGSHSFTYSPGADLQSGTYFLALAASDKVRWVRILYLR